MKCAYCSEAIVDAHYGYKYFPDTKEFKPVHDRHLRTNTKVTKVEVIDVES